MSYTIPPDFLRYLTNGGGGGGTPITLTATSPLVWDALTSTISMPPATFSQSGYLSRFAQNVGGRKTIQGVTSTTTDTQQFAATDGVFTGYLGIDAGALTITSPSTHVESTSGFYTRSLATNAIRSDGGAIIAGPVNITDTTNATSSSTGALTVAGGISCQDTLWPNQLRMGTPCVFATCAINPTAPTSMLISTPIVLTQSFLAGTTGFIVKVTFECTGANPAALTCDILSNLVILPGVRPTGTLVTSSTAVYAVTGGITGQKWAIIFTNNATITAGQTYAFVISIPGSNALVSITNTSAYADGDLWVNDTVYATDDLTFEVSTGAICSGIADTISDDGTLSADSSTTLPTQRAVKQYADTIVGGAINIPYTQIAFGNNSNILSSTQAFRVDVSNPNASAIVAYAPSGVKKTSLTTDEILDKSEISSNAAIMEIWSNSAKAMALDGTDIELFDYLKFSTGVQRVNEITDDITLATDSSIVLPTEHAVKAYVNNKFIAPVTFDGATNDLVLSEAAGIWTMNRTVNVTGLQINSSGPVTAIYVSTQINALNDSSLRTGLTCSLDGRIKQTGIVSGGTLSINADTTKFDIAAGSAWVVNQTTHAKTLLTWSAMTGIAVTNIATQVATWVYIYNVGGVATVYQIGAQLNPTSRRTFATLGRIAHFNKTTINGVFTLPVLYNQDPLATDHAEAIGVVLQDGYLITAGANLTMISSPGTFLRKGCNYNTEDINPDMTVLTQVSPISFFRVYRSGADDLVLSAATTALDPLNYDTGSGSLTLVPVNRYSIQWLVTFPYNGAATVFILYGQDVTYLSLQEAINDIGITLDLHSGAKNGMVRAAIIIRQDQTSLTTAITNGYAKIVMFGKVGK